MNPSKLCSDWRFLCVDGSDCLHAVIHIFWNGIVKGSECQIALLRVIYVHDVHSFMLK